MSKANLENHIYPWDPGRHGDCCFISADAMSYNRSGDLILDEVAITYSAIYDLVEDQW